MSSRLFCIFTLACTLAACSPTIDTTSTTALVTSVAKIEATLSSEERTKFNESLLKVAFADASDAHLLDLAKHADRILPDARASIHNKSASQIIAQAKRIEMRNR